MRVAVGARMLLFMNGSICVSMRMPVHLPYSTRPSFVTRRFLLIVGQPLLGSLTRRLCESFDASPRHCEYQSTFAASQLWNAIRGVQGYSARLNQ